MSPKRQERLLLSQFYNKIIDTFLRDCGIKIKVIGKVSFNSIDTPCSFFRKCNSYDDVCILYKDLSVQEMLDNDIVIEQYKNDIYEVRLMKAGEKILIEL